MAGTFGTTSAKPPNVTSSTIGAVCEAPHPTHPNRSSNQKNQLPPLARRGPPGNGSPDRNLSNHAAVCIYHPTAATGGQLRSERPCRLRLVRQQMGRRAGSTRTRIEPRASLSDHGQAASHSACNQLSCTPLSSGSKPAGNMSVSGCGHMYSSPCSSQCRAMRCGPSPQASRW